MNRSTIDFSGNMMECGLLLQKQSVFLKIYKNYQGTIASPPGHIVLRISLGKHRTMKVGAYNMQALYYC